MIIQLLSERGVQVGPGLTDQEVARIESTFGFRFPPDLRNLLRHVLPVSNERIQGFPDWRSEPETSLRDRLDWPVDGICFDIEHNSFWMDAWGPKPANLEEAFQIARKAVAEVPKLVPIFSHRYIPDEPHLAGNPVFSVYQTDIVYYGRDLSNYFMNEFSVPKPHWDYWTYPTRPIRFWDDVIASW